MEKSGIKIVYLTEAQKKEFSDAIKEKTRAALVKMLNDRGKKLLTEFDDVLKKTK